MRILIAYHRNPPISAYLKRAFEALGHQVMLVYSDSNTNFDRQVIRRVNKLSHSLRIIPKSRVFFMEHPLAHLNYRSHLLRQAVVDFAPDVTLVIRGINFRPEALEFARQHSRLLGWWVEREDRNREALAQAAMFDHFFFFNTSGVELFREHGFPGVSLLQHSVDTQAFRKIEAEKKFDVCFVGGGSPRRQEYIRELAHQLPGRVVIYGAKWLKKNLFDAAVRSSLRGRYIEGEALNLLYNQSRIVLNITNWGNVSGGLRSGMTMRVLEVPATGSFLLTDGSRELASVLAPGEHCAVFDTVADCVAKVRHYLDNPVERERIAQAGYDHVRRHFDYQQIAQQILDVAGQIGKGAMTAECNSSNDVTA